MVKFFTVLAAIAAVLTGGCTLVFLAGLSGDPGYAVLPLILGGIPFIFSLLVFLAGTSSFKGGQIARRFEILGQAIMGLAIIGGIGFGLYFGVSSYDVPTLLFVCGVLFIIGALISYLAGTGRSEE